MVSVGNNSRRLDPKGPIHYPADTIRPFPSALPTLAQCRALLMERASGPSSPPEPVPLDDAYGRVLAEDVRASEDVPGFDRATMDGYAVQSRSIRTAHPDKAVVLRVIADVAAGQSPGPSVTDATAVGVATGAVVPPGADTVVPGEDCRLTGAEHVAVHRAWPPGANILSRSSDLQAGQLALTAGTVLRPHHIGVLAALGVAQVPVFPRLTVAIIATGTELVSPAHRPGPGQVRDSNTFALAAALVRDGARVINAGLVADDEEQLSQLVIQHAARAHAVLISGGSSVGKTDMTQDVMANLGADILFHGIKIKPGKPTLFALLDSVLLVGLPGNPVSALTIYDVLVRPVLRKGMGWANPYSAQTVRARLTEAIRRTPDREELVRVRLLGHEGRWLAAPVPGTSGMIYAMSQADGHVHVPMDRDGYDAGEEIVVHMFE